MMEMIIFAITFVVAQVVAGLIMVKFVMSKRFIKYVAKMSLTITEELVKQIESSEEEA